MAAEGVTTQDKEAVAEAERSRQRAIRSLLGVASRMNYLVPGLASGEVDKSKVAGEMGGMAAWIEAFTCQLGGVPIVLTPAPLGELMLAVVELNPHSDKLVDATARLSAEGAYAKGVCQDGASRRAALALAFVDLAVQLLHGEVDTTVTGEIETRHRTAELRLMERLQQAAVTYFGIDLDPNTYVPELSCHGMAEGG